jgi:hypothetical protein
VQVLEEQQQSAALFIDCEMDGMIEPPEDIIIDRDYRKLNKNDYLMFESNHEEIGDYSSSYTFGGEP